MTLTNVPFRNLFFFLAIVPTMAASLIVDTTPSLHPLKEPGEVTSSFGPAVNPFTQKNQIHRGVDFRAPEGTEVFATADARVVTADENASMGIHIVLQHDDTYETVYAHLSALEVQEGETVRSGDLIGRVGNTGLSKGPHLHYEVHVKGDAVNPEDFLPAGR
jgi:murein DD-endopeptidase MepM/ murein hydrolase activator NlpD